MKANSSTDFTYNCPSCGQKYKLDQSMLGQEVQCTACPAMMKIDAFKANCPHCDQKYKVDASTLGKELTCTSCQGPIKFGELVYQPPSQSAVAQGRLSVAAAGQIQQGANHKPVVQTPVKLASARSRSASFITVMLLVLVAGAAGYFVLEYQKGATDPDPSENQDQGAVVVHDDDIQSNEKPPVVEQSEPVVEGAKVIHPEMVTISTPVQTSSEFISLEHSAALFKEKVQPFFQEHCTHCHGPKKEKGDLRTDLILPDITDEYSLLHYQNIVDEMTTHNMPPEEEPRPEAQDVIEVVNVLSGLVEATTSKFSTGGGRPVRRLTRTEFINTVWDFFGVEIDVDGLPTDLEVGHFENDVETLITTDLHIESYLRKARAVIPVFIENRSNKSVPQSYDFFESFLKDHSDNPEDHKALILIKRFAILAKRGRLADDDYVKKLYEVFIQGRRIGLSFWEALEEPLAISICSIDSLLHFENRSKSKKERIVSALGLANRLSYTLWRSAPDFELVRLGRSGDLLDPEIRAKQIKRMMADEKFGRFIKDFTEQWFELPRQDEIAVDTRVFRGFNPEMKPSMKEETVQFMAHLIKNDLPITKLIDSEFMILNEVMADFYGISGVSGSEFRAVPRDKSEQARVRGGILTHAGILMQGGTGERTSVIERGAFVARKLIDRAPLEPPPDVDVLPSTADESKMTASEIVRRHASDPACANCHSKIDPLGVGLENFDAIGRFREEETRLNPNIDSLNKKQKKNPNNYVITVPLDTNGVLYDGQTFDNILDMKRVLMSKRDDLARGFVKALLTYTNGRQANISDEAIVNKIIAETADEYYPTYEIIEKLMNSPIMVSY